MTLGESFLSMEDVASIGFASVGHDVRISRFARIYAPAQIHLGDEVRIDDFAILSPGDGEIRLAGYNHVGAGSMLFGTVRMEPWSTVSGRVGIYAVSDDFSVDGTTYPHANAPKRVVHRMPVVIGPRVVVGTGSTILPGVHISAGIAVGAMSLVTTSLVKPGVYVGSPARWLRSRTQGNAPA
jgi:dTDP-4-amino-4,6-dideoxy-D-glucose acyltransferase